MHTSPEIAAIAAQVLSLHPISPEPTDPGGRNYNTLLDTAKKLAGSCLAQVQPDEDEQGPPRIAISATVSWDKITNAIVGAFEGGSNDWLRRAVYTVDPTGTHPTLAGRGPAYSQDQFWATGGSMTLIYDDPSEETRDAAGTKALGLLEIKAGLRSMAEKDPRHFTDLLNENDDATTHDVFMQHIVFGEVIYG